MGLGHRLAVVDRCVVNDLSIGANDLNVNVTTLCSLRSVKAAVDDKTPVLLVHLGRMRERGGERGLEGEIASLH